MALLDTVKALEVITGSTNRQSSSALSRQLQDGTDPERYWATTTHTAAHNCGGLVSWRRRRSARSCAKGLASSSAT